MLRNTQFLQEAQKGQSHLFVSIVPCGHKMYVQLDHPFVRMWLQVTKEKTTTTKDIAKDAWQFS